MVVGVLPEQLVGDAPRFGINDDRFTSMTSRAAPTWLHDHRGIVGCIADDSKEGMVTGEECKGSTGIGDTGCGDTVIGAVNGLGVNYEVNPLIMINKLTYLEYLPQMMEASISLSIMITLTLWQSWLILFLWPLF